MWLDLALAFKYIDNKTHNELYDKIRTYHCHANQHEQ
ncbi:hypothetical protein [uncultured Draconibacterium sp.]|nr:hypothetical protein [uncultured Draconibacterium sp.]